MVAAAVSPALTDTDLFLRLWEQQPMTPALARHLLKLGWSADDEARMQELAVRNQEGPLTAAERARSSVWVSPPGGQ